MRNHRAAQKNNSSRRSGVVRSLLATSVVAAGLVAMAPTAVAGTAPSSMRVEAGDTNYVHLDGFPLGSTATISFDDGGANACPDWVRVAPDAASPPPSGDPLEAHPGCDIAPGWVITASLDGGATTYAEVKAAHVDITGFTADGAEVYTEDPGVADPTQIVDYSCGGSVLIHSIDGSAGRHITSPGAFSVDFSAAGLACPEDFGVWDMADGGEFILNMSIDDGEDLPDATTDVRSVPGIQVSVTNGWIQGDSFNPGDGIDVTVNGVEVPTSEVVNSDGFFFVDSGVQLSAGDVVHVTVGTFPTRELVLAGLTFEIDADNDTVGGVTDAADGTVIPWFVGNESAGTEGEAVASGGTWTSGPLAGFDVTEDMGGAAFLSDDDPFEPADVTVAEPAPAPEVPMCMGEEATIVGTDGDDWLFGTPGRDVIVGLGGNDVIFGRGGDDLICAGDGNDVVKGGRGNDALYGEEGNDIISGWRGNDYANGGPGFDWCFAEATDECERPHYRW